MGRSCFVYGANIRKDVKLVHEENHEVVEVVACLFVTKTKRKRKLLQTLNKP
jgi:hypothetical protein